MTLDSEKRHIMVVDDDADIVAEIARALSDRDQFILSTFGNGKDALEALQQKNFDLVVADWRTPEVDGITLLCEAQVRSSETVTVLMSSYDRVGTQGFNSIPVAQHYLPKPFAIDELVSIVDSVFPAASNRKEKASTVLKVVLGGDANVGKTSLIQRYITGEFDPSREMTIGVDFHLYDIQIEKEPLRMVVWDLGGQERFGHARQAFYRGTQAIGLIFDASNRTSFYNLMNWWRETCEYLPDVPVLMLANKTDLPRQISADEACQIAQAWNIQFFESSVATGTGVNEFFEALARSAWEKAKANLGTK